MNLVLLATAVFVPMLMETLLANRNERQLRAAGALEPPGDVYHIMQVAYPLAFVALLVEGWLRGPRIGVTVAAGFAVFVGAKLLKYWAVATLGERWTFRVLVPPDSVPIVAGPYRVLRHPNYVGVIGELVGAALIAGAVITGPMVTLLFGMLVFLRIRIEERALGMRVP